ncbi:MAG: 23S rRNA (adenine(2503)-C(2))-methyltransferase RlmN [Bacillota bacterium]|nr:MAG: 23S rRNA (adenine(2503)-C(2))-methyltransferase RlmN [Planctomycetota bacterium]RUA09730.1 MAG: 23S rRNA (adenine(2503)-C(2))-methyltransferase RlmN [Bacillota bacterium]
METTARPPWRDRCGFVVSESSAPEHLFDLPPEYLDQHLERWCQQHELPGYRAKQVRQHLIEGRIYDPEEMTSLPEALRQDLSTGLLRSPLITAEQLRSSDGTIKFRFILEDGLSIESVWIPTEDRGTLCISSQVGCAAGCTFCATGTMKLTRNLHSREIVSQWLAVHAATTAEGLCGVTQVVFMGMGEPLHNYPAVSRAIDWFSSAQGFHFSPRRITVSTVGVVPRIRELVKDHPQVRLAVSLHSAIPETRNSIVPINTRHDLDQLGEVLEEIRGESRRISIEYVLLPGINDSDEEAKALALFAARCGAHINLLPFHPFEGAPYTAAGAAEVGRFQSMVQKNYEGSVTARRSRGLDIDGACGQLVLKPRPDSPN